MKTVLVADGLRVHKNFKVASATLSDAMSNVFIRNANPEEEGPEYRWMVCRHPLDRLVSAFTFFCTGQYEGHVGMGVCRGMPWVDFLRVVLNNPYGDKHFRPQFIAAGPHRIDKLCRLEHLVEEWEVLRKQFTGLFPLKWLQKTEHASWKEYYTAKQRVLAEAVYTGDMTLYESAVDDVNRSGLT